MSKFEDLERLQYLRENKAITDEEFEIEKKRILNSTPSEQPNIESKKAKQKMKMWHIVIMIILIIVARIYSNCFCNGCY